MDSHRNHQDTSLPSGYWIDDNYSQYNIQYQPVQSLQHDPQYSFQSTERGYIHSPYITNANANDCVSNHHQRFYPSVYMQDPSSSLQRPSFITPIAPRVHINPNYRPPQEVIPVRRSASSRPSVHINPHWKGRSESVSSLTLNGPSINSNHGIVHKKTIFVNPKVLAQHKVDLPKSVPIGRFQEPAQDMVAHCGIKSEIKEDSFSDAKSQVVGKKDVQGSSNAASVPQSTFLSVSSTKLIRRPSPSLDPKHPNMDGGVTQSSPKMHYLESRIDRVHLKPSSTNNLSLRVAKQVCSKYKLVRHSPSALNAFKLAHNVSADTPRKTRRKSYCTKLPSFPSTKSAYKFVRKAAHLQPSTFPMDPPVLSQKQGIHKEDLALKAKVQRGTRRNIKTRYKLVKIQAHLQGAPVIPETSQTKTVKSRYKLVRRGSPDAKIPSDILPKSQQPTSILNHPCHSPFLKSRYKLCRSISGNKLKFGGKVSKFRVVPTSTISKLRLKTCATYKSVRKTPQSLSVSGPIVKRPGLYGNMIWRKEVSSSSKAFHCSFERSSRREKSVILSNKSSSRNLLNIGGVFYRSTPTSLTRANSGKPKERIVHIRGKRFILDEKGTTLRPAPYPGSSAAKLSARPGQLSIARVDLGGVTYTRRSDNTLVRTNLHYARNILSNAKTRSIALLTEKLHKNNQPCLIFHRFGKCHGYEKGKCWRVHDPKNIALCRKFLQGACDADKCPLSHNVGLEKMPTCRYFLEGCCVRDNCPYLHVKLSACAPICRQFLQGYCSAADKCKKRHVYLCPNFDRDGKCCKGKRCPYPHKSKDKKQPLKEVRSLNGCKGKVQDATLLPHGDAEKRKRYYDKNSCGDQSLNRRDCSPSQGSFDSDISLPGGNIQPENLAHPFQKDETGKRPTIGILPAYIPLE